MDWVPFGKFGKCHGLKGALKFYPFHFDLGACQSILHIRIELFENYWIEDEVESLRGFRPPLILKLKGLHSIEEAETYRGSETEALRKELPNPPNGKPYWFDIEGLDAFDENGQYYGRVEEILQTGSNEVYVVRNSERELLLPAIDWVIKKIDLRNRTLIFRVVDGLLEANAI